MSVVAPESYVEVAEVSKIYRSGTADAVEAVSSVSFTVPRGQFVAILGPSGCGKSTLLMMLGGLEALTAGRITVDGMPMSGPRTSIGVMFQDSTLLPWKSALDNVLFPIRVLKRPLDAYRDVARALLERVGLHDFAHKKPHELDLWQQYTKTALFVTHSIREAVFLADRVLVMTRRPATIVEDLTIPFARPRPRTIGESHEFNEICGHLRECIEESHYRERGRRAAPAAVRPELVA